MASAKDGKTNFSLVYLLQTLEFFFKHVYMLSVKKTKNQPTLA